MVGLPLISSTDPVITSSHGSDEWLDWKWQMRHAVRDMSQLLNYISLSDEDSKTFHQVLDNDGLPFKVTPHYLSLIKNSDSLALRRQLIPSEKERDDADFQRRDPLGEEDHEVVPHLIHRYRDRALLFVTDRCAAYCRYCTRKRFVGQGPTPDRADWEQALDYIRAHPEINDVILSGGDALFLGDNLLFGLLEKLQSIPHVKIIRIATRFLTFAPMRITQEFVTRMKSFQTIYFLVHFNHEHEINEDTEKAIGLLVDAGIPVLNQTVLLKGVNDETPLLRNLFHRLSILRVRPYYLHQYDLADKTAGFRVPIKEAISIFGGLRGHLSGFSIPTFVIDIPGGFGKVALSPNPIVDEDDDQIYLRGFDGEVAAYPKD